MFSNKISGIWLLNKSLDDKINNNDLSESSSLTPSYSIFQGFDLLNNTNAVKYGLKLKEGYSYESSETVSLSNSSYSINFLWYSPGVLGFTRHYTTRKITPKISPLIAKGTTNGQEPFESVTQGQFIITECGFSDSHNVIKVEICETGSYPTISFISEPYEPGLRHVFITYKKSGSNCYLIINIDGKQGVRQGWINSESYQNTSAKLYINKVYHGFSQHKTIQENGYLSEIILFNDDINEYSHIKINRFGWESITREDLFFDNYSFFGIPFHQPTTINTQQIYSDGGNIYVARSNGDILKGTQKFWDTEIDISDFPNGIELNGTTRKI